MNHAQLRAAILRAFPESQLTPVPEQRIDAIRTRYPDAPESYLAFLREVGWGGIGGSNFMLYDWPSSPSGIFDPVTAAELDGVLFFGDDFSGWHAGFDTRNGWRIVGVSSAFPEVLPERDATIADFVARWVADCAPRR
jgi:hypothetical protein